MKKAVFVVVLLAFTVIAEAQQPGKIPRIGFLTNQTITSSTSSGPNIEAFRQGLRDLGYTEGKNIIIEYRGAGWEARTHARTRRRADRPWRECHRHDRHARSHCR
jgi:hypothetical protein